MKDELIWFETAKLAKEKGFNEPCRYVINIFDYEVLDITNMGFGEDKNSDIEKYDRITIPTQSVLQKWLRDKYRMLIFPYVDFHEKEYFYCSIFPVNGDRFSTENFNTYEDALEIGLQEALKLI